MRWWWNVVGAQVPVLMPIFCFFQLNIAQTSPELIGEKNE
jgi:hypothetical protein